MENEHVLSGLLRKREELTRELDRHNAEALKCDASIAALEATIRLYNPDYVPSVNVNRRVARSNRYFQTGEAPGLILDYMREHSAKGPVANTAIIKHIAALKGVSRDAVKSTNIRRSTTR